MKTWTVGGVEMTYPIMVGAGVCKTPHSVLPYQHPDLPIGATLGGSYTPDRSTGNSPDPLSAWVEALRCGFNSYGMPNDGYEMVSAHYASILNALGARPHGVSLAANHPALYAAGVAQFDRASYVAFIELNKGCPNTEKVPMSFAPESLKATFDRLAIQKLTKPIWVKLSPFLTQEEVRMLESQGVIVDHVVTVKEGYLEEVASLINEYKHFIRAVVTTNTIGNCVYLDGNGRPVTGPNGGKAGLSGALLKPIARRMSREIRNALDPSIDVIRSGGVLSGDDVAEAILEDNCAGVQVTSLPYWHGGRKALPQLLVSERLQELLIRGPQ